MKTFVFPARQGKELREKSEATAATLNRYAEVPSNSNYSKRISLKLNNADYSSGFKDVYLSGTHASTTRAQTGYNRNRFSMKDGLASPTSGGGITIDEAMLSPSQKNKSSMQERRKSENFSGVGHKSSLLNFGAGTSRNSNKILAKQNVTAPE